MPKPDKKQQLGKFVWVDVGKTEHPAFLVNDAPPITDAQGTRWILVEWQTVMSREYVRESSINDPDMLMRRSRKPQEMYIPEDPTRGRKRRTRLSEDPDNLSDPASSQGVTTKGSSSNETTTNRRRRTDENTLPRTTQRRGTRTNNEATARGLALSSVPAARKAQPLGSGQRRSRGRSATKRSRSPEPGDYIFSTKQGPVYQVLGVSVFSNRFRHLPKLVQLRRLDVPHYEVIYVRAQDCARRNDPNDSQRVLEAIQTLQQQLLPSQPLTDISSDKAAAVNDTHNNDTTMTSMTDASTVDPVAKNPVQTPLLQISNTTTTNGSELPVESLMTHAAGGGIRQQFV